MSVAKIVQWLCHKRYQRFLKKLEKPLTVQLELQKTLSPHRAWNDLPIVTYPDIEATLNCKRYVETSGTSCKRKKIPLNRALLGSFTSLFKIWAADLLKFHLKPPFGRIFMCLSPPGSSTTLKDDTHYLNPLLRWILKPFLIIPSPDPQNYMERVAEALKGAKDLSVISIWNPTYLLHVMDLIEKQDPFIDWKKVWPNLQLISCWADGWAKGQAETLKKRLPHVMLQGKGLLATEAPLTVPLWQAPAPVPLIDEVVFEFEDEKGNVMNLGEVQQGKAYELIISQKGGLLRYRIGDRVLVSGQFLNTPCLTFLGRAHVSDMVGEKLDAPLVEKSLEHIMKSDWVLIPLQREKSPCCYLLVTELPIDQDLVEQALQQILHYKTARLSGQLGPVEIRIVPALNTLLHNFYQAKGLNWGDIKGTHLLTDPLIASQAFEIHFNRRGLR